MDLETCRLQMRGLINQALGLSYDLRCLPKVVPRPKPAV
jgi:hypothetical protein